MVRYETGARHTRWAVRVLPCSAGGDGCLAQSSGTPWSSSWRTQWCWLASSPPGSPVSGRRRTWRGSPTSARGVRLVVDLRTGSRDGHRKDDPALLGRLGVGYLALPVPDGHVPSEARVRRSSRPRGRPTVWCSCIAAGGGAHLCFRGRLLEGHRGGAGARWHHRRGPPHGRAAVVRRHRRHQPARPPHQRSARRPRRAWSQLRALA